LFFTIIFACFAETFTFEKQSLAKLYDTMKRKILLLVCCLSVGVLGYAGGIIHIANPVSGEGWTYNDGTFYIHHNGDYAVTGKGGQKFIEIDSCLKVQITLDNVEINDISSVKNVIHLGGKDTVTIHLLGRNILNLTDPRYTPNVAISSCIGMSANSQLVIDGTGSLDISTASPNIYGGSGSAVDTNSGSVTINGGTITAFSPCGAGIEGKVDRTTEPRIVVNGGMLLANLIEESIVINGGVVISEYIHSSEFSVTGGLVISEIVPTGAAITEGWIIASNVETDSANVFQADIDVDIKAKTIRLDTGFTVPEGKTLIVPEGATLDVNHKTLTNNGIIREYGSIINNERFAGNAPVGAILASWIQDIPPQTYTGDSIKPVIVNHWSAIVIPNIHYTVTYNNNVNAGTATFTVTDKGNNLTVASKPFFIAAKQLAGDSIEVLSRPYTGDAFEPPVTIKDGSRTLIPDTDYTVAGYSNNVDVGVATVTVTGMGNYTGTVNKNFYITKALTDEMIQDIAHQSYNGRPIQPEIIIKDGEKTLLLNTDYEVQYANNINAGTATAMITGKGVYTGTVSKEFIIATTLMNDMVQNIADQTYTGSLVQPALTIIDWETNRTLDTADYEVRYANNMNVGTAMAMVTGKGIYTGMAASKNFTIVAKPLTADMIYMENQIYTGAPLQPPLIVKYGTQTLVLDRDYENVRYSGNINVGTATVTITGKGNYSGAARKQFSIAIALTNDMIQDINNQIYTGNALQPPLIVKDGTKTLILDRDYENIQYSGNTNKGTATVSITGKGDYSGVASKQFLIVAKPLTNDMIDIPLQTTYTGSAIEPATVKDGAGFLTPNKDYTVAYSDNINAGTAVVTITGQGDYAGTIVRTFDIVRKPLTGDMIAEIPAQLYTGNAVYPSVTVRDGNKTLVQNRDYAVFECRNNVKVGTATIAIVGVENYCGEISKDFEITAATGVGMEDKQGLFAVPGNEGFFIFGLTPGETFSIYNSEGKLFRQGKAVAAEERIYLRERGVYVVIAGKRKAKVVY
jgi:hypothetical protein